MNKGSAEKFEIEHKWFATYFDINFLAPGFYPLRGALTAGIKIQDFGGIIFNFNFGCPGSGFFSEVTC